MTAMPSQVLTPLLIFPCNGNGLEALDCLGERYQMVGFIDDTPEKQGTAVFGHPVLSRRALQDHAPAQVLAVPGGPASFRRRVAVVEGLGLEANRFATVIHPSARISPLASIGRNVLIMAGVVVTSNAVIGDHVCILPNTVVHHDVVIGDWTLVGSNVSIAGGARLGSNCYVGSGSRIINGVEVGDRALIGLGSNVIRGVARDATVAGNPARLLGPAGDGARGATREAGYG
jgi:sugar O-acyltransferase (sialic acid O-acetyltransferase NeuD family)